MKAFFDINVYAKEGSTIHKFEEDGSGSWKYLRFDEQS